MSTTIIAVCVQIIALGLPALGLEIGTAELTTTIQTLTVLASGFWVWYRRVQQGDVTPLGVRR